MAKPKKANYPSPCEKCERKNNCSYFRKCQPWLTRYYYRQKQINAYAKKVLPDYNERIKVGIHYDHEN